VSPDSSPKVTSFGPVHRDFDGSSSYDIQVVAGPGGSATIYSTGYVSSATLSPISRAIIVTTTNSALFTTSVAAVTNVSMTGKVATFSDSFDSTDPKGAIGGNGEVACLAGSVSLASSTISGDLLLGPSVTNISSQVSGKIFRDFNIDLPEVVPPSPYWLPAPFANKTNNGITYRYAFNSAKSGNYTVSAPGSIYVGADAKVTLQLQSAGFSAPIVYVAGANQHADQLTIYALQPGVTLGDVTVESGKASKLVYLGSPQNTSLTLSNNSTFTGTIYAPAANFTNNVSRGKDKQATFTGSLVAKSVRINGAASFRFDEDLLRNSPMSRGFVITSWKEL